MSEEQKKTGAAPKEPKSDDTAGAKAGDHVNPSAPEDANTTPGSTGKK